MHFTKTNSLLAVLAAANYASAHTTFTNFYVDGVDQGPGVAVRMNHNAAQASFPVENLASDDMACGFNGADGVSRVASVDNGATLTFEFHSWADDKTKPILDPGHKGPCAVYLKKVDSAVKDAGHGDGWFKIWDEGYDGQEQKWCTDKMIDNNGVLSVALPKDLEGGYYLVRPELIALHNALNHDPQFYVGCGQIFLENGGNLGPSETVSIPGYVNANEESMTWNLYYGTDPNKYPVVGPKVATLVQGAASKKAFQSSQTEGTKPAGCILENANFCAFEVPSYSDEKGCWAAAQNCWDQNQKCWDSAPPTGGAGCKIWEGKCQNIDDQCNAKNFNGPPNKGKDLTAQKTTIAVNNLWPTSYDGPAVASPTAAVQAAPSSVAVEAASSGPASYSQPTPVATPSTTEKPVEVPSPVPTPAPASSSEDHVKWLTVTDVVEVTQYEYVTVHDKYRRGHVARRRVARYH